MPIVQKHKLSQKLALLHEGHDPKRSKKIQKVKKNLGPPKINANCAKVLKSSQKFSKVVLIDEDTIQKPFQRIKKNLGRYFQPAGWLK